MGVAHRFTMDTISSLMLEHCPAPPNLYCRHQHPSSSIDDEILRHFCTNFIIDTDHFVTKMIKSESQRYFFYNKTSFSVHIITWDCASNFLCLLGRRGGVESCTHYSFKSCLTSLNPIIPNASSLARIVK